MVEELEVLDPQGDLLNYLRMLNITKPTEVILNYPMFIRACPDYRGNVNKNWKEICGTINKFMHDKFPDNKLPQATFFEDYNEPDCHIKISKLRNSHVNQIVVIDGMIRKVSESKEEVTNACWICTQCGAIQPFDITAGVLKPRQCKMCNSKKLVIYPEESIFRDVQYISLQESQMENGRQPKSIKCRLIGSLVDSMQVGSHCSITGIVRVDVDNNDLMGDMWIDVIGCDKPDDEYSDIVVTEEDIRRIKELSKHPDIYRELGDSINPGIWGYTEIKVGLILQAFGGVTIESDTVERVRGDSHILLCGDPSMAKSQLLRSMVKIIPRCIYTSGKSTSAAGLTVAAVRDELTGQWTLEAGALVLANGSFCVIDELDKMSPDDRSALHEAMESQSISVAKAGINQTLKTVCPMLCAANPKMGRFIREMPIPSQIDLPPALLSRFDLIFMLLDEPNPDNDRKVATRILENSMGELKRTIDIDTIRKYIIYAKQFNPVLPDEVKEYLISTYLKIRSVTDSTITPRQLEALKRLTQSAARVQLLSECTIDNAKLAVELFEFSMNTVTLGKGIDTSVFDSNASKKSNGITSRIYELIKDNNGCMLNELSRMALDAGIDEVTFNNTCFEMLDSHMIRTEFVDGKTRWYIK